MKTSLQGTIFLLGLAFRAEADDFSATGEEIQFGSLGMSVASPPPSPPPVKKIVVANRDGLCPPNSKNEVCRCVNYNWFSPGADKFVLAANPPKYCSDKRLVNAFSLGEAQYVQILFSVQADFGIDAHDGVQPLFEGGN